MAYGLDATFAMGVTIIILTSQPQYDAQLVSQFLPFFHTKINNKLTKWGAGGSEHPDNSESLLRNKVFETKENESEVQKQIAEAQRGGESSKFIFH